MWPNARISVMGGEQAAAVLATVKRDGIEAAGKAWSATRRKRSRRRSASSTSARATRTTRPRGCGTTASSIRPTPPRARLALSASLNAPIEKEGFGVFRM
jgi:3-methylcrotonyl-CoA carboxylase beta subunit